MERAITASEANQRFSEMLRDVQGGDSFVVTSRGRPVAKVVPIEADLQRQAAAIDDLLEHMKSLPRKVYDWKREDLYD